MKKASTIAATTKFKINENEADTFNKVKKFGAVAATEQTKRAALGDLQNRGVLRAAAGKDAAQKDVKATAKSRVDSHWKKAPLSSSSNGTTAQQKLTETNRAGVGAGVAQRKVLTRSSSVRLAGTNNSNNNGSGVSGTTLQRHHTSSNVLLVGQNKAKTLTTKVIESKVQQVKYISKTKIKDEKTDATAAQPDPTLRREDSNLSRRSLSKLKAALSRDATTAAVTTKAVAVVHALKKEPQVVDVVPSQQSSDLKIVSVQSHSPKFLSNVEDIDAGDSDNLMLVSEYVNDIYRYLYSLEVIHPIRRNHLEGNEEIYPKMRAVLIDWINEVHTQFHCVAETFQMAVAIIDRYLQAVKDTKRSHLQLVGVTALFIAAKYEELFPPAINDFVYITDETYSAQQILQMEIKIIKVLDFNLSRPLPLHFLRRYSKAASAEDSHHAMSKYFLELSLIEYDLAHYKPSEIAAASLFLSLHLINGNSKLPSGFDDTHWTPTLEWYSNYTAAHLRPIAQKIAAIARNAANAKLKAVYSKYQSQNLLKISSRPELTSALMESIVNSKE